MNSFLGEMYLVLGEEKFLLRPSFDAMVEIESICESGIMAVAALISQNQIRAKHVAAILYGGIVGGTPSGQEPKITFEEFKVKMEGASYSELAMTAIKFLNKAMRGREVVGAASDSSDQKKTKSEANEV
jgi:hypothetical protein